MGSVSLDRSQVRQLFLADGFTVCSEAENGREAIEVARDCNPGIIILDVAMPVMGGIEAAPKLRELLPDIPIILFTLHADYLRTIDLASLGISAALSKNGPLDQLLDKAHELMED